MGVGNRLIHAFPPKALALSEMQTASSRIWTWVTNFVSTDDNHDAEFGIICIYMIISSIEGDTVLVIAVGNGHGGISSSPGRGCLRFTLR